MENEEKIKIKIFPAELEITKDNKEKISLKITENFTNDSKPENIYANLYAQNAPVQTILESHKSQILEALSK